jgi:ATP-dependent DNA helicase RecG
MADMTTDKPMNRLLQGDVGSGKTLVAVMAMLLAAENGFQSAIMAPTEILAEQHFRNISRFVEQLPVNITLLTGGGRKSLRDQRLYEIASGNAHLVIGTHALFQKSVRFHNLGLVIIDEQHRFGVLQRGRLREKGVRPDTLVMTATPIPRTLALTVYGDLDVSVIREMPPGRQPISTHLRTEKKLPQILKFIRDKALNGEQSYIVFPLVSESEKLDLRSATESHREFTQRHLQGVNTALVHGQMPGPEKDRIMREFAAGQVQVLFATTVVEVGVDNPQATVMLVMHAERFGLSQLHQLRGRVGRGSKPSHCILVTAASLNPESRERLQAMVDFRDGFKIAEADLRLRGSGDFFGTRQAGLPTLRLANLVTDGELLDLARQKAFSLVREDPHLLNHPEIREYYHKFYHDRLELIED